MNRLVLPRREFLNLLGIGAAFTAGAMSRSPATAAEESCDGDPSTPPPPSGEREPIESQVIKDQPGIRIIDRVVEGGAGLKLIRCPGAVIENLEAYGSSYSGLWLDDCPDARVAGGIFHDNGRIKDNGQAVGHGIHLSGDCNGILIQGVECHRNIEDGIQQSNSCTGNVTYRNVHFHHNKENGFDSKGGFARFENPNMHDNGYGTGHPVVIVHNNASGFECFDGQLVLGPNQDNAGVFQLLNGAEAYIERTILDASQSAAPVFEGGGPITAVDATLKAENRPLVDIDSPTRVVIDNCLLVKPGTKRWYKIDGELHDICLDCNFKNKLRVVNCRTS